MLPEGIRRFFRLGGSRDVTRDVDAEIAFHLEQKVQTLRAAGMTPEGARAEALRQFGDVTAARDDLIRVDRDETARRGRRDWRGDWWLDLRQAGRSLARTPGLTAAVLVMLGLGIGGASVMFGLLDRVLFSVGPHVESPAQLRRLYINRYDTYHEKARVYSSFFVEPLLRELGAALPVGSTLAAMGTRSVRLGGRSGPEIPVALYSGDAFRALGVGPQVGRLLDPSDDTPTAPPAAVISDGFWRRHFGGVRDVVGRTVELDATRYTIVGVAPKGFSGLRHDRVDVWVPLTVGGDAHFRPGWRDHSHLFEAIVRVAPGADPAPMALVAQRIYQAPDRRPDTTAVASLESVMPWKRPGGTTTLMQLSMIVGGVAAMLCFIAVANATNLLLLRAVSRRRETAVRIALGAGRARLVRGVLVESTMLALGGAAAAGIVAGWGGELLRKLIVHTEWQQGILDPRVLAFAGLLGLVIGIVTGLVPGMHASRPDAVAALKAGVRTGAVRSRLRSGLLAFQAALTIVLISGLGLYTRSFLKASGADYVVDAEHLINVNVATAPVASSGLADSLARVRLDVTATELAQRMRAVPGVVGVARASIAPIYGYGGAPLRAEGVASIVMDRSGPFVTEIDTAFLAVTGLPLLRGRTFTAAEAAARAPVALVNDAMARKLWPGQEALGKCLFVGPRATPQGTICRPVVGVVSSYRNRLQEHERMQNYYLPLGYAGPDLGGAILVQAGGRAELLIPPLTAILRERLPESEPDAVRAIGEIVSREVDPWRAGTTLFALFAGLAVFLAMGGLYSVVAFSVVQRAHEFSIRIAVGARAKDLVRLVIATALRPVMIGLTIGLALTLWLVRFLADLLYETGPRDPVALGAATAFLLVAAGIACVVPARRAVRTDPREALQAE